MQLFRRRIQYVAARQVNAVDWAICQDIATWCGGELADLDDYLAGLDRSVLWLPGFDGLGEFAEDGDWVVRLENNTFIVMPDQAFWEIFELAELQ